MKKLLLVILCASIISPSFAFADSKSEKRENGNSHKSAQIAQKNEKKEEKREKKEEKKEIRSLRKDNDNKRHYATTTATTTQPVQIAKKINYFLCKTDSGWSIVPLEGVKNKNSSKALGRFCMKLPYGFAKRFYGTPVATTTPDIVAPVISGITTSGIASTTATVSWNTNELATGKLYFGTSTPLTAFVSTTTLSLAHSFNLTGLTASTTYQLLVESADSANNIATTTASLVTTN